MAEIRTLIFLSAPFDKWKAKGWYFVGTFKKNCPKASFEKKSEPPIAKACHPKRERPQVANNLTLSSDFMNENDLYVNLSRSIGLKMELDFLF